MREIIDKFKLNLSISIIGFGIIIFLQYWILEWSAKSLVELFQCGNIVYLLIGIFSVFFLDMFIILLVRRIDISIAVVSAISLLVGMVNYYVTKLYGEPFSLEELANAKTAFGVLGNYSISIEKRIIELVILCIVSIVIAFILFKDRKIERKVSATAFLIGGIIIYMSYGGSDAIIPRNAIAWSWGHAIREYGYVPSFVQQSICGINAVQKPKEYNEKDTVDFTQNYVDTNEQKENTELPDIIFILNETFYDLDQVLKTETSDEVFSYISSLENVITGYTTSPKLAGGTNQSEYEFLSSNSMHLMPVATPFASLDMEGSNTVVSYLESLGYTTLGTHCYLPSNYSRNKAYPAIGFDYVKWDSDYINTEEYGDRAAFFTDECVFENLNNWYSQIANDSPVFMYCLTVQNHGGWESNPESFDLVHSSTEYGDYTDVINEYMSCVYLSDKAFETLVEYYSKVERDVIIVMTGDHCPSIAKEIVEEYGSDLTEDELQVALSSTPFVIWANHEGILEDTLGENNRFSLFYLAPTVLEMAEIPLSGYYDYLVELRKELPILLKSDAYYDKNGTKYLYDEESKYSEMVDKYFAIEYLNIKKSKEVTSFFMK